MKVIAVRPGKTNSVHLAEIPAPSMESIPDGRGVRVRMLRLGIDGTDKEINFKYLTEEEKAIKVYCNTAPL